MSEAYRPELVIHILSHPACPEAPLLMDELFRLLVRDPDDATRPGLNIPFFSWRQPLLDAHERAHRIPLAGARHVVVIALVDRDMALDPAWGAFLATLAKEVGEPQDSSHRLLPVTLSDEVFKLNPDLLSALHYIRLHESPIVEQPRRLKTSILHEFCRLLLARPRSERSHAPVQLFLSHAKRDGVEIAGALKKHLCHNSPMEAFFDARDIAPGHPFAQEIEGTLGESALIAIQTDAYASREWCRREVMVAKRLGKPVLVVNAVEQEERRLFPYLGNAPSIRWRGGDEQEESCRRIVDAILLETLRINYFSRLITQALAQRNLLATSRVFGTSPELAMLVDLPMGDPRPVNAIVYPDPPLGRVEMELLEQMRPGVSFLTPCQLGVKP